jgi:hypothetical protein
MLYRCIYASRLAHSIDDASVESVLAKIEMDASRKNEALKLSGMLLSVDRHFMQILEGSNRAISALLGRLYSDQRHTDIILLEFIAVEHRIFPEWSMKSAPVKRRPDFAGSVWNSDKLTAQAILNLAKSIRAGLLHPKSGSAAAGLRPSAYV